MTLGRFVRLFKARQTILMILSAFVVSAGAASAGTGGSPVSHLHAAYFMPCPTYPAPADPSLQGCQGFGFDQTRVASTLQAVLIQVGDAESSREDCQNGYAATAHTLAIDGNSVPLTVNPCRYFPPDLQEINPFFRGRWGVFYKYLIDPGSLASGIHEITFTTHFIQDFTYSLDCPDPSGRCTVPAGTVDIHTGWLIIE